jgi:hypothetical protein
VGPDKFKFPSDSQAVWKRRVITLPIGWGSYGEYLTAKDALKFLSSTAIIPAARLRVQLIAPNGKQYGFIGFACCADTWAAELLDKLAVPDQSLNAILQDLTKADWIALRKCGKIVLVPSLSPYGTGDAASDGQWVGDPQKISCEISNGKDGWVCWNITRGSQTVVLSNEQMNTRCYGVPDPWEFVIKTDVLIELLKTGCCYVLGEKIEMHYEHASMVYRLYGFSESYVLPKDHMLDMTLL